MNVLFPSKCCHLYDYDCNDYHDGTHDNAKDDNSNCYDHDHNDYHEVNQQEAETQRFVLICFVLISL